MKDKHTLDMRFAASSDQPNNWQTAKLVIVCLILGMIWIALP
jgi:hypothetical protein